MSAAHETIRANGTKGLLAHIDKLGLVIAAIGLSGLLLPFANFRANRIVQGEPRHVFDALPTELALALAAIVAGGLLIGLIRSNNWLRLVAALFCLATVLAAIGLAATYLSPEGNNYARVSPASGFWLLFFASALYVADGLVRLRAGPFLRVGLLVVAGLLLALLLSSGLWDSISFMKEYQGRADSFWNEAQRHIALALGSLLAATVVGIPLGLVCHRVPKLRAFVLNSLNIVQTIPSMALFGILIAPLSWVATQFPWVGALGIRGIGAAPAFVALFLYSLLPIVANTVAGLAQVPEPVTDAARGMGMTRLQRLFKTEFPLAFPVILTGIRIVMVQNIGLTTIAALIGGGGFGTFVFQGIGQTAMDLVLLGALPTVLLAFAAAVILDAAIEITEKGSSL
ncbi:ABC transporter permease [Brucella sp. ZJ1_1]|uniref:ABC transporter permease n=3 Tax=Brucella intermedia TaxID=94625 RepID=U4VBW9_9HYPH|nr:ABC transporter permease [Brucella intermedia]ERM02164.1 ABC transporter permease [Brucella intermedia 229E]ELT50200.1 binding-protein-dependent transport system inner membrane protein [Brucella intermedia M86]MCB4918824.1 ABC transporter permease [Brucella intermedia]OOC52272.1 ABC transporter permease [Brucella intermedia M86]SUB11822.1 Putative osmoprotectant uptake system permease protein yehY [Brucella intermedia]